MLHACGTCYHLVPWLQRRRRDSVGEICLTIFLINDRKIQIILMYKFTYLPYILLSGMMVVNCGTTPPSRSGSDPEEKPDPDPTLKKHRILHNSGSEFGPRFFFHNPVPELDPGLVLLLHLQWKVMQSQRLSIVQGLCKVFFSLWARCDKSKNNKLSRNRNTIFLQYQKGVACTSYTTI